MSLISTTIPNFVNGISQQPYQLRLPTQGESQENGYSTVYSGLRKRAPTEHLAKISVNPLADCFCHMINRDDAEQYQVIVTNGDLKVYDLAGNAKTVNFSNKEYLNVASGLTSGAFALTTVADYTFIVNRGVKVLAAAPKTPTRPFEALINVKAGNYGKTYKVIINGTVQASFVTPDGTSAGTGSSSFVEILVPTVPPSFIQLESGDGPEILVPTVPPTFTSSSNGTKSVEQLSTDYIANQLFQQLVVKGFNTGAWTVMVYASVIYLKYSGTVDFKLSCDDGFNNNAMIAIKDTLQKFSDLPPFPRIDGFMVQIVGDESSDFDNYWVKFDAGANNANGVWREWIQPNTVLGLDVTTMPHELIREANGTFTFKPGAWAVRTVGDITSNPDPSFVGQTINDIFFFQNRLGFLSDENFIQSEVGKFFNLFRTTVTTLLDSDPVDVNAATDKVAILQHAVSFNKQLLLFSKQQQFVVDSTVLMTPKKVPIRPTTNFAVNTDARPVTAGRNVYFATDKGNWSAIREFYAETMSTTNDAADITAHVPMYLPSGIVKIASGAPEDVMAILSSTDRSKLFIYKYFFSGTEKLQSSWSHYTFNAGGVILNCDFIKSVLYLVISRPSGVYLEKMDFAVGATVPGEPYTVLLDRKVQIPTSALSYAAGVTTINLAAIGYTPNDGPYMVVTKGGGSVVAGTILAVTWNGASVTVPGNVAASALSFGLTYTWRYQLSTLAVMGGGRGAEKKPMTDGRTQVRKIVFNHAKTGYYRVLVTPFQRQTYTYIFTGAFVGTQSVVLGTQQLDSGKHYAPVMSRNTRVTISLESDMPLPVSILSADWEAFYADRSQDV